MADQPDSNDDKDGAETPAVADSPAEAAAPDAAPDAAATPAADASGDGADASGEDPAEQAATDQPAPSEPADTGEPVAQAGASAPPQAHAGEDPAAQLSPKERRRKARSTHTGKARPSRTPQERHAERLAERKDKATRRRALRLKQRAKAASRRSAGAGAGAPAPDRASADARARAEGTRKIRQGIVVSDKADKSITVRIDVARRHRRYEKIVRSSSTLHAHDEDNDAHEGDTVRVIESRPLSRTKRWRLVEVLERAR